jgi:hypothetical protein
MPPKSMKAQLQLYTEDFYNTHVQVCNGYTKDAPQWFHDFKDGKIKASELTKEQRRIVANSVHNRKDYYETNNLLQSYALIKKK